MNTNWINTSSKRMSNWNKIYLCLPKIFTFVQSFVFQMTIAPSAPPLNRNWLPANVRDVISPWWNKIVPDSFASFKLKILHEIQNKSFTELIHQLHQIIHMEFYQHNEKWVILQNQYVFRQHIYIVNSINRVYFNSNFHSFLSWCTS